MFIDPVACFCCIFSLLSIWDSNYRPVIYSFCILQSSVSLYVVVLDIFFEPPSSFIPSSATSNVPLNWSAKFLISHILIFSSGISTSFFFLALFSLLPFFTLPYNSLNILVLVILKSMSNKISWLSLGSVSITSCLLIHIISCGWLFRLRSEHRV